MARTRTFATGLDLAIWDGGEARFVVVVEYEITPAFEGSRDEPAHDASAEITAVRISRDGKHLPVPAWLSDWIEADTALLDSLVADASEKDASDKAEAAERRAEVARDDLMMGAR